MNNIACMELRFQAKMIIHSIDLITYTNQRQLESVQSKYWTQFNAYLEGFLNKLQPLWNELVESGKFSLNSFEHYLQNVYQALNNQDNNLACDYLQMTLRQQMIEVIAKLEENIDLCPYVHLYNYNQEIIKEKGWNIDIKYEDILSVEEYEKLGYCIERTMTGSLTIKRKKDKKEFYLYSNCSPMFDGVVLNEEWLSSGKDDYVALGFGLGYQYFHYAWFEHMRSLTIYEEDIHLLEIAMGYTSFYLLSTNNSIRVVYDPGYAGLIRQLAILDEEKTQICLYEPLVQNISDLRVKEKVKALSIQMDNAKRYHDDLKRNFQYNTTHINHSVMELKDKLYHKDVYLVAGGPSLELNIAELKNRNKDSIILCAGTSFKRMLSEGIHPDYVILTDPKPETYEKISGIESETVPLILLSTALYLLTQNYSGNKYLVCQQGYEKAEELAKYKDWMTFESGSSVMTVAIDIALKFECSHLIFLGMDLAFTNNKSHHSGGIQESIQGEYKEVEDVFGHPVKTIKNLMLYQKWIEERIQELPHGMVIDATEGGAKIRGTEIMTLKEWLVNTSNTHE